MTGNAASKRLVAGAALLGAASFACGAEPPWSIGAGLGRADFGDCRASCDERREAYKVFGGYRFGRHLALEAGYVDLGKVTATAGDAFTETKPRGIAGHLVGAWPVADRLAVFGRLGFIHGDTKVTGSLPTRNVKGTELAWGLGAQLVLRRGFTVRLDWDRHRFATPGGRMTVDAAMLVFTTGFGQGE